MRRLLMAAMLLAMGAAGAAPPLFKCVDGGKVTYQDHPCDDIHAAQCHTYTATPIVAQGGNVMAHYNALFAMIDKELAEKRAAAAAAAVAAQADAEASGSDDAARRSLCHNSDSDNTAESGDQPPGADCDEQVAVHTVQASAGAVMVAPGRR